MRGSTAAASSSAMAGSNRRQPARSARTATTRPSNYYARTLGYPSNTTATVNDGQPDRSNPPGFFPAITHFTDGLSALPKEVMRHFTLIKETEGKAYLPDQAIVEILDTISQLPEPPKEPSNPYNQPFLGFSLNNSVNGSAPGSVIDGILPATQQSVPEMDDRPQVTNEQLETRRACFSKLRDSVKAMLNVLDEKNMVLTSANDTLARHLSRLDGTLPHVESEISEEARLGSNTHWALPHMRELRKANGSATNDRSRRDVQAANSLALAAATIHEGDIAATRSEARREAVQAKRRNMIDSDFDDRPPTKRALAGTKARKNQDPTTAADGKGSTTAQPHKRRRVDKNLAPGMERSASGAQSGRSGPAGQRERDPSGDGPARKKTKPLPAAAVARKRNAPSSPSIASSPTRGTFATTTNKDFASAPGASRGVNPRARQNSALSVKSAAPDSTRNRPPSAGSSVGPPNGTHIGTPELKSTTGIAGRGATDARPATKGPYTAAEGDQTNESERAQGNLVADSSNASGALKREETEPADGMEFLGSGYNSRGEPTNTGHPQGGNRASKTGTPIEGTVGTDGGTGMARSRSTRGWNGNGSSRAGGAALSPSTRAADEAPAPRRTQKKTAKAYAESTRSSVTPPLGEVTGASARNTNAAGTRNQYASAEEEDEEAGPAQGEGEDGYVSSDEPRYCVCNGPSYGNMIGCDNEDCPREWFHLACVGMTKLPGLRTKWYCDECKENMKNKEQQRRR